MLVTKTFNAKTLTCNFYIKHEYKVENILISLDTFKITKGNGVVYFANSDVEYIYFKDKTLSVDKESKEILISEAEKDALYKNYTEADVKNLINRAEKIDYSTKGSIKKYNIKMKSGPKEVIDNMEYEIDSLVNIATRIRTCYVNKSPIDSIIPEEIEGMCVDLLYEDIVLNSTDIVNENMYIRKEGKNYIGEGEYKDYNITNYIK
ncbi:MAG: hypothetical protein A2X12_02595 [Bacteroidetes bacterium GWE2_29_8]|nr:MAG: hypothetical protein A2X12_02595 [Bacteroidetes bacterium GWE2_29_8]